MDIEVIRRLNLARHLYELATTSLNNANDVHLFSAVNLLQDAVEAFLLGTSDYVGAVIDYNTKFDKYFTQINEKIAPKELPFKSKLLRLNRIRVDSKHYGIQPARDECERIIVAVKEFFDEVCTSILGAPFSSVSAIDLLKDGETKALLLTAKSALEAGQFEECAICCRKAIYIEIESRYDISEFKDGKIAGLLSFISKAPYYCRNKEYIDKNVNEPTDFIVYDHASVNEQLLTQGVDNIAYWNVWRLTPEVYRRRDKSWVVKHDFGKLDANSLRDRIDYIFAATLDVVLSIHSASQATQWNQSGNYYIDLAQEGVPVYKKADRGSEVAAVTFEGMTRIDTDYRVDGLNGDGPYWHVSHYDKEGSFLWGFIHNDFVR